MKWYWVVECSNTVGDPLVIDSGELTGVDEADLKVGKRLEEWKTPLLSVVNPENRGTPDDVVQNHLGLLIFSPQLRDAMNDAEVRDIQYLDVMICCQDNKIYTGYSIANILSLRSALDIGESEFDIFPEDYFIIERRGSIRALRKPVLRGIELNNCDIMRLCEYPFAIYVSQNFKNVFERHVFTGLSFRQVDVI